MDDDDNLEAYVMNLRDKEFEILIPVLALTSCANSRAMELGGGFGWSENGWQLSWPYEVAVGFGIRPVQFCKNKGKVDVFKVLFEPLVTEGPNYWSTLFDLTAPALVISYEANSDKPPVISPTDEEWLLWDWYVSDDEKITALEQAIAAQRELEGQVDYLALAKQASTVGPRSTLFTVVAAHLARQTL